MVKIPSCILSYFCCSLKSTALPMKFSYLAVLIEVLFLNLVLLGQGASNWKQVRNSDNIIVYVKKIPASQLKKVKVETVLKTTLTELVTLIKDAENHNKWVFFNERARIIEETDDFHWKYYGYMDSPWPVFDRDFITDVTLCQDKTDCSITILSVAIPDFLPEDEDCVRIPYLTSLWCLVPMGNDSIHISLELEVDIGGKIPIWLVNMAVTKGPLSTIKGLIKELKIDKHSHAKLDYIYE